MKLKKTLLTTALVLASSLALTSCGQKNDADNSNSNAESGESAKGSVYYLNFKPEVEEVWNKIAKTYTDETGVPVKVVTAASGTYESTLKAEITKKDAPTLFQINGPIGYQNWKDYTKDLKDSELYKHLIDKELAVKDGEGVFGIPYVVEGYGIIYNDAILQKYIGLDGAKIKSVDEIKNFEKLKEVAEDMQAKKEELGIDGAFASTSLKPGEDWRWQTHLANLPIYYEYKDNKVKDMDEVKFKYADNYKNIFDLYIKNSTVEPNALTGKAVTDSMAEFALEKAAFVQNGNWAWSQISEVSGNKVKEENIKFLPVYTGVKGEEKQGICVGTENFFSVNSQASEEDQKATEEFLTWLFTSEKGKEFVTKDLGFISPFDTFEEKDQPSDPLAKEVVKYMSDKD
ncbi:MAG: ABC transporter substrate-binding protein, partial [Anaerococcus vaginalis]|nr:ABC transporter substrate-binding protein [Anaerococcus vaginalis]